MGSGIYGLVEVRTYLMFSPYT